MKNKLFTIPAMLSECCRKFENKPALLLDTGAKISYKDMLWDITRTCRILREQGISKGHKVAVFVSENPQSVVSFLAVTRLGAIAVPVTRTFSQEQINHIFMAEKIDAAFINAKELSKLPENTDCSILEMDDNRILKSVNRSIAASGYTITDADIAAVVYETDKNGNFFRREVTHKELATASKKKTNRKDLKALKEAFKGMQIPAFSSIVNYTKQKILPLFYGKSIKL
jgi:acyl-coenzyme A synthetase/AMP-(fatty) acid ligase